MPMKPLQSWIETEHHWKWQKTEIPVIYILFFSLRNIPCKRNHLIQKENEREDTFWLEIFRLESQVHIFICLAGLQVCPSCHL